VPQYGCSFVSTTHPSPEAGRAASAAQIDRQAEGRRLRPVRVWDLPTRLFHWLLALAIVGSVVTGSIGGNAMVWHFRLGYLVFGLLIFRLVWGLVGGRWSRFVSFVYSPSTVLRYLRGQERPGEHLDVGHNPLGAGSVFAMLSILAVQVGTGLIGDDEIANVGPLNKLVDSATGVAATAWHKGYGEAIILALVALHIAAILYYRLRQKKDLIGPMLSGDKALPADVPAARDDPRSRGGAVVCALVAAGVVYWLVR
jgi:cytochrome b